MSDFDLRTQQSHDARNGFGPFRSIAVPRPVGFISTVSKSGIDNLAAFSRFANVNFNRPHILFSAQLRPDGHCGQCRGNRLLR